MSVVTSSRRFNSELVSLLDHEVKVRTVSGKEYRGILLGFDINSKDLVLGNAKDSSGTEYPRVFIFSNVLSEIITQTPPIDMEALARILEEKFPKMIRYFPEARTITVMEKIRVTDEGVFGSGPIAEKVRKIFEEFVGKGG